MIREMLLFCSLFSRRIINRWILIMIKQYRRSLNASFVVLNSFIRAISCTILSKGTNLTFWTTKITQELFELKKTRRFFRCSLCNSVPSVCINWLIHVIHCTKFVYPRNSLYLTVKTGMRLQNVSPKKPETWFIITTSYFIFSIFV